VRSVEWSGVSGVDSPGSVPGPYILFEVFRALVSSGAVCLGLILLALYQVPTCSVNVLSSARPAWTSTTGCSFNGPVVRNRF